MDVEKYLERISYTGCREPNVETLQALCRVHVKHIVCSNLAFFGRERVTLDPQHMFETVITKKQPGICFELNALFAWLLEQLEFKVKLVHSRHLLGGEWTEPYYHMMAVVTFGIGEEWLCDVSFFFYEAVSIKLMQPQVVDGQGLFRIREVPGYKDWYYFEKHRKTVIDGIGKLLKQGPGILDSSTQQCICERCNLVDSEHWKHSFMFTTEAQELNTFSKMNNYHQEEPGALMQIMLIAVLYTDNGYYRFFNKKFEIIQDIDSITTKIEETTLTTDQQVTEIMKSHFGVELDFELKYFSRDC